MQLLKLNSRVNYEGKVWTLTKITNKHVIFSSDTSSKILCLDGVINSLNSGDMTHA
jgi:hypothetical protein